MRNGMSKFFRCALGVLTLVCGVCTSAGATSYVYDDAGRVIQILASDGSSIRYQYDSVGNMTSTIRVAAGAFAINSFAPASGNVGTSVTIDGAGFSGTIADNVVKFNGIVATVTSASPT